MLYAKFKGFFNITFVDVGIIQHQVLTIPYLTSDIIHYIRQRIYSFSIALAVLQILNVFVWVLAFLQRRNAKFIPYVIDKRLNFSLVK